MENRVLSAERIAELVNAELFNIEVPVLELPAAQGATFHTSRLRPGDIFFALPGATTHGIAFADDALAKGAAFIVSDRFHERGLKVDDPAQALLKLGHWARANTRGPVVGVTGSVGKTTTKAFLAAALGAASSPGNLNTPLALAAVLFNNYLTTGGTTPLVLELGIDHVGEMATLVELVKPTHGLLTAVAASHLEGLGSVETVAREKSRAAHGRHTPLRQYSSRWLFETIDLTNERDDLRPRGLKPPTAAGGLQRRAEGPTGQSDRVIRASPSHLNYPGAAVARNAVGALVIAEALGVSLPEAAARLEQVRLESGRLTPVPLGGALLLDDSYNSNPASASEALAVLRAAPGPHTAILGDMLELGSESRAFHEELGQQTVGLDNIIAIGREVAALSTGNPQVEVFASFGEALPVLASLPLQGTILVKASRGMHFERVIEALQKQRVAA